MSYESELCEKVVDTLNGAGGFSLAFTASYSYWPSTDPSRLQDLAVDVVPIALAVGPHSRTETRYDHTISVGVRQRVAASDTETIDGLRGLVEEIADHLANRALTLAGGRRATFLSVENPVPFDPQSLSESNVFTSVLQVTYRVTRKTRS